MWDPFETRGHGKFPEGTPMEMRQLGLEPGPDLFGASGFMGSVQNQLGQMKQEDGGTLKTAMAQDSQAKFVMVQEEPDEPAVEFSHALPGALQVFDPGVGEEPEDKAVITPSPSQPYTLQDVAAILSRVIEDRLDRDILNIFTRSQLGAGWYWWQNGRVVLEREGPMWPVPFSQDLSGFLEGRYGSAEGLVGVNAGQLANEVYQCFRSNYPEFQYDRVVFDLANAATPILGSISTWVEDLQVWEEEQRRPEPPPDEPDYDPDYGRPDFKPDYDEPEEPTWPGFGPPVPGAAPGYTPPPPAEEPALVAVEAETPWGMIALAGLAALLILKS